MNVTRQGIHSILLVLIIFLLAGCGSSSEVKAPQTTEPVGLEAASAAFPNAGLLVSADSLQVNVTAAAVASPLVIIDARSADAYALAHIPGAINLQHSAFWNKGVGLNDTAAIAAQLGAAGIADDSTIVIYDNTSASWGAAGRLFWMFEYLGSSDVHLLDGGWDKCRPISARATRRR
jgi:thiosulfate/3-mercaptopyruvate sulfurtransferase